MQDNKEVEIDKIKNEYQLLKDKYAERSFKIMALNQITSTIAMERDIQSLRYIISDMFFEVNLVQKAFSLEVGTNNSKLITNKNCNISIGNISIEKMAKEFDFIMEKKVMPLKELKQRGYFSDLLENFSDGYCIAFDISAEQELDFFVIFIGEKALGQYSDVDDEFIETISGQIRIILENAISHNLIAKKNKELNETIFNLQVLNYGSSLLNTTLEINELLRYTAEIFFEIFNVDKFMIFNYIEDSNSLKIYSSTGYEFANTKIEIKMNEINKFRLLSTSNIQNFSDSRNDFISEHFSEEISFNENTYLLPFVSQNSLVGAAVIHTNKNIQTEFYNTLKIQITTAMNNARLYASAITDGLTQVYNHMYFKRKLKAEMLKHLNTSIILLDIDYFKKFNDSYGHTTGDRVLRDISKILKSGVRKDDIVARYGGEEFAILLPDTSVIDAVALAERLRSMIEEHVISYKSKKLKITASFGVGESNKSELLTAEQFVDNVDKALYTSKSRGRNIVSVHENKRKEEAVTIHQKEQN